MAVCRAALTQGWGEVDAPSDLDYYANQPTLGTDPGTDPNSYSYNVT